MKTCVRFVLLGLLLVVFAPLAHTQTPSPCRMLLVGTFLPLGTPLSYDAAGKPQTDKYGRATTGSATVAVIGSFAACGAHSWRLEASDPATIHVGLGESKSSASQVITVDANTTGAERPGFLRLTSPTGAFVYPQASMLGVEQAAK